MPRLNLTFSRDQRGSVSVIAAYFFIIMSGASALTIQGSDLYVKKLQGQRTADIANLAAAMTPSPIVSGSASTTAIATAANLAAINGFGSSTISTTATNGGTTLNTTIVTPADLLLSSIYSTLSSTTVYNTSTASPPTSLTAGCVVSLGGAVQIASSATVTGTSCDIMAKTGLILNSAGLTAHGVSVGYTSAQEAGLISGPTTQTPATSSFNYSATITDPVTSNSSITAIKSHLTAMSSWPYATTSPVQPSYPTVPAGTGPVGHSSGTHTVGLGNWTTLTEGNLTNLSFDGSGGPDPNCTNPTTFSGDATFTNTNNMNVVFNSGCYIFGGNFTVSGSMSIFGTLAPGAQVTFIFKGNIINKNSSGIQLPAATYSIKGNIDNSNGNWITLGDGQKVIGGAVLNNTWTALNLGNGPFYFLGGISNPGYGSITIGNGPTYVYNSPVSTGTQYWGQPTVSFGNGPFYFYNSPITHGSWSGIAGLLTFASGPYYFYNSSLTLATYSLTYFGWGNMDLYSSSINASGSVVNFGNASNASTGSMLVSFSGGSLFFAGTTLTAKGVTMAQTSGTMYFIGSNMDLEAPTPSSPTYGYQNIAIVSTAGDITIASDGWQNLYFGGLLYAPNNSINLYYHETVTPPTGQCLQTIASAINIYLSANLKPAPCANLTGSTTASTGASLK